MATTGGLQPWLAVPATIPHSVAPLALNVMRFCKPVCWAKNRLPALSAAAPSVVHVKGSKFCHMSAPVAREKAKTPMLQEPETTLPPLTRGGVYEYHSGARADLQTNAPVLAASATM